MTSLTDKENNRTSVRGCWWWRHHHRNAFSTRSLKIASIVYTFAGPIRDRRSAFEFLWNAQRGPQAAATNSPHSGLTSTQHRRPWIHCADQRRRPRRSPDPAGQSLPTSHKQSPKWRRMAQKLSNDCENGIGRRPRRPRSVRCGCNRARLSTVSRRAQIQNVRLRRSSRCRF
jgi:hypothetical protein